MCTTIDLLDSLYKKIKTRAIEEVVTMKDFLLKMIHRELETHSDPLEADTFVEKKLNTRKKKKYLKTPKLIKSGMISSFEILLKNVFFNIG